jgi:hypothetical protein
MDTRCPRCHGWQTTKVTAIVAAETTIGSTHGGGVGAYFGRGGLSPLVVSYHGTTQMQSMLARRLSPPPKPQMRPSGTVPWTVACGFIAGCVLCFLPVLLLGLPGQNPIPLFSVYSILFLPWLLGLVLSVMHTVRTRPQRKAEYQANVANWQTTMYNWSQSYYCHTCDSVFLPELS